MIFLSCGFQTIPTLPADMASQEPAPEAEGALPKKAAARGDINFISFKPFPKNEP